MSEPETLPRHVHPEVALLPWYVNGTLDTFERQRIARHLETCESCRAEVEELSALKAGLAAMYDAQPGPSAQTARSVFAVVSRELHVGGSNPSKRGSWLESIDQWLRSLFLPQWIPTLAAVFLIVQAGLLFWMTMPSGDQERIVTRSLDMQSAKIAVAFQATATEEQIRALLQSLLAHVVDGPTQDGIYVIEMTAADVSTVQDKMELLKKRTDVVRSVEEFKR